MPMTPLQAAADAVRAANRNVYSSDHPDPPRRPGQRPTEPPAFSPPISVEALSAVELRYQWERLRCLTAAGVFRRWLYSYVAWCGIPLDNVIGTCELLGACVEATLLAGVKWPELAPAQELEDEAADMLAELDAEEMGLTITPPPRGKLRRRKGTLPGCATDNCLRLRRPGELYCPPCARKLVQKWRSES